MRGSAVNDVAQGIPKRQVMESAMRIHHGDNGCGSVDRPAFAVAQHRRRLFFIGHKDDELQAFYPEWQAALTACRFSVIASGVADRPVPNHLTAALSER